jgi:hypothetical protein
MRIRRAWPRGEQFMNFDNEARKPGSQEGKQDEVLG